MPLQLALIAAIPDLTRRYTSPDRDYHNLAHIQSCLALFRAHRHTLHDPEAVEAAIWFHDAVYDPTRSDNEEQSADLAIATLTPLGVDARTLDTIHHLILATKHNAPPPDPLTDFDTALLIDIDLAILGSPPSEFDPYEAAIRREYAHVPDAAFRTGRTAVLKRFLHRSAIYTTRLFNINFEENARQNLRRSIDHLRD